MSRTARPSTPAGRDAGLRRLRTLNRVLIGAAVAGTGLLADVAAQAFPGHRRAVRAPVAARPSPVSRTASPSHRRHARRRHHHVTHPALSAPAQAPTTTASPATNPAPAPTTPAPTNPAPAATTPAPAAPAPAPQVTVPQSPAPVVSGGS